MNNLVTFHNIVPSRFTAIELCDLSVAIQEAIKQCDERINSCNELGIDTLIWDHKKASLTRSLDKLTFKYQ